jgi:peptide/nickel transport system ATP-binding protein/oligopeptide transport system ATP-binding protein
MADPLLDVRNLRTEFLLRNGSLTAVNDVSFQLAEKETLGIVGESGSGKSVLALSLMRLVPQPPGKITNGQVIFKGEDLLTKSEREMRSYRGKRISMIFQEPMVALNPAYTVGDQVAEGYRIHEGLSKRAAYDEAANMLDQVGIPNPRQRLKSYPHEFSGGMRQRVMIAIALACNPDLLIADEPTTALDVTIQAQILDLLRNLIDQLGKALIFITHDLGVAAVLCDRIAVMYASNIVELANRDSLFANPKHPYTQGLLRALPRRGERRHELDPIPGTVCDLRHPPAGCNFCPRCDQVVSQCDTVSPHLRQTDGGQIACHLYQ